MKEARVFDLWSKLSPIILSSRLARHVRIVSKGGTALNKIFLGESQRFSEDLDFDAFFKRDLDRSQKIIFLQENVMSSVRAGYAVDQPRVMREVVRFTCAFKNEMGQGDSLSVEFNIETPFVGEVVKAKAASSILPLRPIPIPVYSFHTLVAKKFKAFYERESGKDLYDIYRSFEKCGPSDMRKILSILKNVLEAEGIAQHDFTTGIGRALSDSNRLWKVHGSTNPYIPRPLRIDWGRAGQEICDRILPMLP